MRLIDADAIELNEDESVVEFACSCIIESQPTVDAEPIVHAHWVKNDDLEQECSRCGGVVCKDTELCIAVCDYDYCPGCGAKMDEEE